MTDLKKIACAVGTSEKTLRKAIDAFCNRPGGTSPWQWEGRAGLSGRFNVWGTWCPGNFVRVLQHLDHPLGHLTVVGRLGIKTLSL